MESLLLLLIGFVAGGFGSILGLGGGIIMVPALTLLLNFPAKEAVGMSLIAVAAGSTSASIDFLKSGRADLRLGLIMETVTTVGAVIGAFLAGFIDEKFVFILFSIVLLYSAASMLIPRKELDENLYNGNPSKKGVGMAISFLGGNISGLLGVGGGIIKVPVMNLVMGMPLKIASATSSYMVGITAATGAVVYLLRGDLDFIRAAPITIGILAGSSLGAYLSYRIKTAHIKWLFAAAIIYTAARMIIKAMV